MTKKELSAKANSLPSDPGVYLMKDKEGTVIYVGKAKNLKNRVTTYFREGAHTLKTQNLVKSVFDFEVIITASEIEALYTEASLIKKYSPKYNILLKDGRGYPFIKVSREKGFPLITVERSCNTKGNFFGPYLSNEYAAALVNMLKKAYRLPTCKVSSPLFKSKKTCLQFQLGNCRGFCADKVAEEESLRIFGEICGILDGKISAAADDLEREMTAAAERLDFEMAAELRDRIKLLNRIKENQSATVQNRSGDYIAARGGENSCSLFFLRVKNGYIVAQRSDIFQEPFSPSLLQEYVERLYSDIAPQARVFFEELPPDVSLLEEWLNVSFSVPSFANDRQLLSVAKKNAGERLLQFEGRTKRSARDVALICSALGIKKAETVELYDASHFAGTDPVCGMVVYKDGEPFKQAYKKFILKSPYSKGDTQQITEALTRRLKRYFDGDTAFAPLPDLILCDGGILQVNAAEAVISEFGLSVPVAGLKKDSRHRTKALVTQKKEIELKDAPELFALLGRMQEEVHRYSVSFQRERRKDKYKPFYEDIKGLGRAKATALMSSFRTIDEIRNASVEQLVSVKGITPALAEEILKKLNGE